MSHRAFVYQPPAGVPTETQICDMFDNFMNSVESRSDKAIIYNYILAKAKEGLEISTATNKSNDVIYIKFHNITYDVERHTSLKVKTRIYNYIFAEALDKLTKSGGKKASSTYKSNGDKIHLLIDNKRLHRSIYVKGNGKAKYCKINNEFVLLSKLKNKNKVIE